MSQHIRYAFIINDSEGQSVYLYLIGLLLNFQMWRFTQSRHVTRKDIASIVKVRIKKGTYTCTTILVITCINLSR